MFGHLGCLQEQRQEDSHELLRCLIEGLLSEEHKAISAAKASSTPGYLPTLVKDYDKKHNSLSTVIQMPH